jgi:uncharacterized protein YhhL (DUF1145 family)
LSLATLASLAVWLSILLTLAFTPLPTATYLLQVATLLLLPISCAVSGWFLCTGLRIKRGFFALSLRLLLLLAAICILWAGLVFNLMHIGLNY